MQQSLPAAPAPPLEAPEPPAEPAMPPATAWEQAGYLRLRRLRDRLLAVPVAPLAWLGVPPAALSGLGVAFAGAAWWAAAAHPRRALACLVAALLCDAADGALARRVGRSGAPGKLLDQVCDTATLTAAVAAALAAGVASPVRAVVTVWLTGLLLLLAVVFHTARAPGGWAVNPRGGFFAHAPRFFVFAGLALYLAGGPDLVDPALLVANLLSAAFAVAFLWALLRPTAGRPSA